MARNYGTWLFGPPPSEAGTSDQGPNDYRGQRLGLPEYGPGALAGTGRRIAAMLVDWFIAVGLTGLAPTFGLAPTGFLMTSEGQTVVLGVWLLLGAISVRLYTFTPGQLALGLCVASVDHRQHVGIGRAVLRGLLIVPVVTALFTDTDGRGYHDRLTGTAVVRR